MSEAIQTRNPGAVSVLPVLVVALALPGAIFAGLILITSVFDLHSLDTSVVAGNVGMSAFLGGVVSIITTPVAGLCAWFARRRLNTRAGVVVKIVLAIALCGWLSFILRYANPFFVGS